MKNDCEQLIAMIDLCDAWNPQVDQKLNELEPILANCPSLEEEVNYDMSELDSVYIQLKNDLKDNMANQEVIEAIIEKPEISISILKTLSRRLRYADERIKGLAFLSVEGRVFKYLLDIGEKSGLKVKNHTIIEKGPTQIEIANSCGSTRETVSRVLKILIKKGAISVRKRQYTLYPFNNTI